MDRFPSALLGVEIREADAATIALVAPGAAAAAKDEPGREHHAWS